jgi:thiosulfate/3-mercaptopyruvate sulfurtransferase
MFRAFGHTRSSILDGGLPNWIAHGGKTRHDHISVEPVKYETPKLDTDVVHSESVHY